MMHQILTRLKEATQYLEHIGTRLTKDQKLAGGISFEELNTEHYKNAIHHIDLAIDYLNKQQSLVQQYQKEEQAKEESQPSNRISSRIDTRF